MIKGEKISAKNRFAGTMSLSFLLAVGVLPLASQADPAALSPQVSAPQIAVSPTGVVTYEGQPSAPIGMQAGAGSNIPFAHGIKQIVPEGWHAYKQKGLVVPDTISWAGGSTWVDTLKLIGTSSHVNFIIKWDEKIVQVVAPRQATMDFLPQAVVQPVHQMAKVDTTPVQPTRSSDSHFTVNPGTVKDAFNEIATRYGFSLHWVVNENAGVYKFNYPVVLPGKNIRDDLNVLNDALGSGKQSLFALDLYEGNKVIRVKSQGD